MPAKTAATGECRSAKDYCTGLLRAHGVIATAGSVAVLELLRSSDGPLTHERILRESSRDDGAGIERATLYRILNRLVKAGLCKTVCGSDGVLRYMDASLTSDIAFECTRCHTITGFSADAGVRHSLQRVIEQLQKGGLSAGSAHVSLRGRCTRCGG